MWRATIPLLVALGAIFLLSGLAAQGGRPDFFYLADAFLRGRPWIDQTFGFQDVVEIGGRYYLPFAPFPAIAAMPIVAVLGPAPASELTLVLDVAMAVAAVGLFLLVARRVGVDDRRDLLWLALLLALSTPVWWLVTRGGVWNESQLLATVLTFGALVESFGRRRPLVLGLLAAAALLTRTTLLLAVPFYGWILLTDGERWSPCRRWFSWGGLALFLAPSLLAVAFTAWYDWARFGSPLESGYALATLPPFLEVLREQGLFSVRHLGMNLDYLFLHLPAFSLTFPFLRPDGFGLSILLTSPGLLLGLRADWRSSRVIALAATALLVLVPTLLYYGGGWLQYGYRYALDSIPFVLAIVALAVARRGMPSWGRVLILVGVAVNLIGVYWAYKL